jgi:Mn2+/Fe2+ NRAMP family transporter
VLFKVVKNPTPERRAELLRLACVALPVAFTSVFLVFGAPVTLVLVGAIAQGLMLPFLALAALYFHLQKTHPALRPGLVWTAFLSLSALAMAAVGVYQVVTQVGGLWK